MNTPLSPRAITLVNASRRDRVPISHDEAAAALMAADSPLFPAWLYFLTHYGGMKYRLDNSAILTQTLDAWFTPEEVELPLNLRGEIILDSTRAPILDLGYFRDAGPFGMGLDVNGMVLWDYEIPVFSTFEKLLESDAVYYEICHRADEWWCLRGAASSVALQELARHTSLQVVEAAEDRWNQWWVGEEVYVHHFAQWEYSERASMLWLFMCGVPSEIKQNRFAACFDGPTSLTRWP